MTGGRRHASTMASVGCFQGRQRTGRRRRVAGSHSRRSRALRLRHPRTSRWRWRRKGRRLLRLVLLLRQTNCSAPECQSASSSHVHVLFTCTCAGQSLRVSPHEPFGFIGYDCVSATAPIPTKRCMGPLKPGTHLQNRQICDKLSGPLPNLLSTALDPSILF